MESSHSMVKVASFLPAYTDTIVKCGGEGQLVGISDDCVSLCGHELSLTCLVVAKSKFDSSQMTSNEIQSVHRASSLSASMITAFQSQSEFTAAVSMLKFNLCSYFHTDVNNLIQADPDVIVTHIANCDDQFITESEIHSIASKLLNKPNLKILSFDPNSMNEIYSATFQIGNAIGRAAAAQELIRSTQLQIQISSDFVSKSAFEKVFVVQWIDPLYISGGWVSEILQEHYNVNNTVTRPGGPSENITWEDVIKQQPDLIVFAACGMSTEQSYNEVKRFAEQCKREWNLDMTQCDCVRRGNVVAVDARRLFTVPSCSALLETAQVLTQLKSIVDSPSKYSSSRLWVPVSTLFQAESRSNLYHKV
mmetsp:Transcript_13013/g.23399  ORF Transcript_13013/g.23399 Transcript_13013/m.23399 type:complete len:364 (-) Transcript_13013:994-2085(-)